MSKYTGEVIAETVAYARRHGIRTAARKYGMSPDTVAGWLHKDPDPTPSDGPAVRDRIVPNHELRVEGLPADGTVGYIDPENVARNHDAATLYVTRKRDELKIEMVDAAIQLARVLAQEDDGTSAKGLATALGTLVDKIRIEGGQLTGMQGVVDLRQGLATAQAALARAAPDLTMAIEAQSSEAEAV